MKQLSLLTLLTLPLLAQTPPPTDYILGPGDQITVFVAFSPC